MAIQDGYRDGIQFVLKRAMLLSYQDSALTSMKDIEKDIVRGIARDQTVCMTIHDGARTRVTVQPLALFRVP